MMATLRWPRAAIVALFLSLLALFSQIILRNYEHATAPIWRPVVARDSLEISRRAATIPPTQQNPVIAPPIPIITLSSDYIANISSSKTQSSRRALNSNGAVICTQNEPCADGSCCGNNGICGYGPTYCGAGNCTSNCDALAMCGRYSDDGGTIPCGMNLCCSYYGWCGTTENHCGDPDPHGLTPCQAGYGLCQIVPPPSCGQGSGSTNGRTIAYYQASNTYNRVCNKVSPSQITTSNYTHLYFAFANIDPGSYEVVPADNNDVSLYSEFTALKNSNLETWIAIGGFDFSDPGTSTFTTWSNLSSSASNRATFISSLQSFMSQYGFQGVDLDWEYPSTPERGGERADMENYVTLVKEMRAAFGSQYGISLTLAPDYWYLRGFDAKAMESSVDWFGFMAYDLHGFWDADVKTLGSEVRGQTDIRDIANDTLPLWFDALDPSKINFGLAYYGRGYTLSDPSCDALLCPFSGPSKPGVCTNFPGVLSLREIQQIISDNNLTPTLLQESMMKQIVWDGQWMGYDDPDTWAMKKAWADGECFGGTMAWSVDFYSGSGSGDTPPVTTNGTCGAAYGTVCGDWSAGGCCSSAGFCGNDALHCGNGCQSGYGNCTSGLQTTDGTCGAQNGDAFCGTFQAGPCCSASGFCGNSADYCGNGCQSGCPTADGTCGSAHNHNTCNGWSMGNCCSSYGECGSSTIHCGSGCQSGNCTTGGPTTDGTCGPNHGNNTCEGWSQGPCCSSSGFCGGDDAHCGAGCVSGPCTSTGGTAGQTPTTDGSCGPNHGNTTCAGWPNGECCSSSGFCGRDNDHCGSGCLNGPCIPNVTSDGSCGPNHGNTTCQGYEQGECCSSSGFCGAGDGYCGVGCLSGPCDGGSSGSANATIFLDPGVLTAPTPVACIPPCTFVFPPWILPMPTTIQPAPTTLTFEVQYTDVVTTSSGGTVTEVFNKTTITTISFPAITTTEISIWEVVWTDTSQSIIYLTSSINVPPLTLTEGSDVIEPTGVSTSSSTTLAGIIYTYSPDPYPPVPPGTQTTTPPPPPGTSQGHVTVTSGPPSPTCTRDCPAACKTNCVREPPCIGICGCIGPLCGPCLGLRCPPGPPNGGITSGGGGNGGGGGGNESGDCEDGEEVQTASSCDVVCYVQTTATPTSTCETSCQSSTTCGTPSNTASTTTVSSIDLDIPTGIPDTYNVTTFPDVAALVSAAMSSEDSMDAETSPPTTSPPTTSPPSTSPSSSGPSTIVSTIQSDCVVCTVVGGSKTCAPLSNCPATSSTSPTSTPQPTIPAPPTCNGGLTLQLYSDKSCVNPLSGGNICLKYNSCFNSLHVGWSSMRVTSGQEALPNHQIATFNANSCALGGDTFDDLTPNECLRPSKVANAVGEGSFAD